MKNKFRVAIHENTEIFDHSTSWSHPWAAYCEKNNIDFEMINCYESGIIDKLKNYDCLLWHFSNYVLQDMLFARSILTAAKQLGLKVFPDVNTAWHFDDKIAETYLLQAAGALLPASWIFYSKSECANWLKTEAKYPLVGKLRCGSGSNNVKLLKNSEEALAYINRMFGKGYKNVPSVFFKMKSNLKSAADWDAIVKRMKRIPDFLQTLSRSKMLPREHGYAYFQEFVPNDGYDLKIAVVGDKLSFIARNVREGDFRASGGGSLYFDKSLVTSDIIQSAFETSDRLGFQCMGYDYVVDKRTHSGIIIEVSYGFSHTALLQANGYWDREGTWHDEALNAPEDILKNLMS